MLNSNDGSMSFPIAETTPEYVTHFCLFVTTSCFGKALPSKVKENTNFRYRHKM
jgi:hypothetical protein